MLSPRGEFKKHSSSLNIIENLRDAFSSVQILEDKLAICRKVYDDFFVENKAAYCDYLDLPQKIQDEKKSYILENKEYQCTMQQILFTPNPDLECLEKTRKAWHEKMVIAQNTLQKYEDRYAKCKELIENYSNHSRQISEKYKKSLFAAKESLNNYRAQAIQIFFTAIRHNEIKKIDSLLNAGLSVEYRNVDGLTPLLYAIKMEKPLLVQRFLEAGENPNIEIQFTNAPSMTPLIATIVWTYNNTQILQLLINHNATLDLPNNQDNTALHVAISMLAIDHAVFLLRQGANFHLYNIRNETPLNILENRKHIFWHKEIRTVVDEVKENKSLNRIK
jgi:hypothetical protein